MANYKLTSLAALDFENLFEFGIEHFGVEQALNYQKKMEERFRIIADYPLHYPIARHIHEHYRMSVFGAHSIYYKVEHQQVLIVRILGRQSADAALKE